MSGDTVATKTYRAVIERDADGAWIVRVPSIRGCHTYGRTLQAARRRIREALDLWVDDTDHASIEFEVHLPADLRSSVRPVESARDRAERAQQDAQATLRTAARKLVRSGLSLRDAADLLAVSHQRVAQLLD